MNQDSFIFYRSFYEAIQNFPDGSRGKLYETIIKYIFTGEVIELNGTEKSIFILIRPLLDANTKRYLNGKKGGKFGKLGGRPKNPIGVIENNPIPFKKITLTNTNTNINTNKYNNINTIKEEEIKEIADKYRVPESFVKSKIEDMTNWLGANGKKYKNYYMALCNWVKKDGGKVRITRVDPIPELPKMTEEERERNLKKLEDVRKELKSKLSYLTNT